MRISDWSSDVCASDLNEVEAFFGLQRDRAQRHDLISAQLKERAGLQSQIGVLRDRHARLLLGLYRDAAQYRRMMRDGQFDRYGTERARPATRGPAVGRSAWPETERQSVVQGQK